MMTHQEYIIALQAQRAQQSSSLSHTSRLVEGAEIYGLDENGRRDLGRCPTYSLSDLIDASTDDESVLPPDVNDAIFSAGTDASVAMLHDPRLGFFERMDLARALGERGQVSDEEYSSTALQSLAPDKDASPEEASAPMATAPSE